MLDAHDLLAQTKRAVKFETSAFVALRDIGAKILKTTPRLIHSSTLYPYISWPKLSNPGPVSFKIVSKCHIKY
jgi:hypothetical protein